MEEQDDESLDSSLLVQADGSNYITSSDEDEVSSCDSSNTDRGEDVESRCKSCSAFEVRVSALEKKVLLLEQHVASVRDKIGNLRGGLSSSISVSEEVECQELQNSVSELHPVKKVDGPVITTLLYQQVSSKDSISSSNLGDPMTSFCPSVGSEEVMIQFGSVSLPASRVNQLRHKKDTILAADLCSAVFTPQEMALCSMEGKVNNKYGLFRKYPIDKCKVEAIVNYICNWKGEHSDGFRKKIKAAIANKLGNFCKTPGGRFIIENHKHFIHGKE